MELTAKALREAEFRDKRGGYHPEDVDRLLEEVADGVEVLQDRLRQAVERAQRAEAAASSAAADTSGNDDALRRTLVLAQRTADLAVSEAREQASRIVASAEQQAQALLADAEERARRAHDEAISEIRSELVTLEAVRQRGQQEVDLLNRWVEEHRTHLASTLKEALTVVDRAGTLSPAPSSRPLEFGQRPSPSSASREASSYSSSSSSAPAAAPAAAPPALPLPVESPAASGQATIAWQAPDLSQGGEAQFGSLRRAGEAETNGREPTGSQTAVAGAPALDPEEQALDDFFDDGDVDEEDRRFGGRLRRRR
jgi:DivIVA domain-containing protein